MRMIKILEPKHKKVVSINMTKAMFSGLKKINKNKFKNTHQQILSLIADELNKHGQTDFEMEIVRSDEYKE